MSRDLKLSLLLLFAVEGFLLFLFPPSLLFDPSYPTGGDMASHVPAAAILRDRLFSFKSIITWVHGNYGGFPLFLHYFPLPFLLAALASPIVSLAVAMKLVVLLSVLALPVASFACLRNLGFRGLAPGLGALFTLLFLVLKENPMWGGNIASTMAGEFSYALALALAVWFTGRLHRDVPAWRGLGLNALIEALIAMASGYPLLQAGFGSAWFAFRKRGLAYVTLLHILAFALAGFWLLPLVWRMPWNTPYDYSWDVRLAEVVPVVLWPALAGIVTGFAGRRLFGATADADRARKAEARRYLTWQVGVALLGFGVAPLVGLVDIRFLPFAQVMILLLGAAGWADVIERLRSPGIVAGAVACGLLVWAGALAVNISPWIRWDFSGFETKPLWKAFRGVNEALKGTENDPRVFYEHAEATTDTGTVRAFELLPFLSGRSTLEGLYMQSSLSSPFVFALQAELSWSPSSPFPGYYVGGFDVDRAVRHLRLFNVDQVIAVTERTCRELDATPLTLPETMAFEPFRIYRLTEAPTGYVEPLRYRPFRVGFENWRKVQYQWFRRSSLEVPLVLVSGATPGEFGRNLPEWLHGEDGAAFETMPKVPLGDSASPEVHAVAILGEDTITIDTDRPGHPLWVKVSYHPDWRITDGAGELYATSPAFMLLVPHSGHVVLTFDTGSGIHGVGKMLTVLACAAGMAVSFSGWARSRRRKAEEDRRLAQFRRQMAVHGAEDVPEAPLAKWRTRGGGFHPPPEILEEETNRRPLVLDGRMGGTGGADATAGPSRAVLAVLGVLMAGTIAWNLSFRTERDPVLLYNRAVALHEREEARFRPVPSPGASGMTGGETARPSVFDESRKLFERVLADFPNSPPVDHAAHYLMSIAMREGRFDEAAAFASSFLLRYPDARVAPEALYTLGVARWRMADPDGGLDALRRTALSHPGSDWARHAALRIMEWTSAADVLKQGRVLLDDNRPFDALPWLDAARQDTLTGLAGTADFLAATARFQLNQFDESLQGFSEWTARNANHPDAPEALFRMAQCHMNLRRYVEARRALDQALTLDPNLATTQPFASFNRMVREILGRRAPGERNVSPP